MTHFLFVFLLTLLIAVPGSSQEPAPDPHEGQPAYCVNHPLDKDHPLTEPHICACAKPCEVGQGEDPICKVYCRPSHCHCSAMCDS